MAQNIDALQIEISAKATSANNAINRLTKNLDKLSTSLNSLNVSNVGGLSTVANQTNAVASGSTKMNNALKKTNTTMKSTSKQAWSLARAFGKFYANYFLIIRGAKALWGSIESTADYIEAYNYYNVAFGKIASEWQQDFARFGYDNAEAYADSFVGRMNETLGKLSGVQISVGADGKGLLTDTGMKNLGLNIQEITQYASQLASVTNSLGQTGETSLAIAQSFTKLAGDISSLFNVDYSTVSKNLQSGLIGQSRALYKYGIDITNATLQTKAYELGLSKAVSEMTQAEKMQLRTLVILEQSKVSWGDLANTINSPSNMIRQLSTNLKEAGMVLGQLFIPMLGHVLPVVNGATIALKRLLTEIAGFFGVEIDFEKFGQGYNQLEDETGDLADSYDDLASSVKEAQNQFLSFDDANKLSDTSATLSVGTEDNTIDLTDEIVSATEEYQKVWDEAFKNMELSSSKWADRVQKALDGIGTVFEDFAIGDFFKAGEDVSQLVIDLNNFIAKAIKNVDWKGIGNSVGLFLKGIKWLEVFKSLGDVLASAVEGALDFWLASFTESPFETVLLSAVALLNVSTIQNALSNKLGTSVSPLKISVYAAILFTGIELAEDLGNYIGEIIAGPIVDTSQFNFLDGALDDLVKIRQEAEGIEGILDEYLTLSFNFEGLSEEDKEKVKSYADVIGLYAPDAVKYIDQITGAWKGTGEELSKLIKKTELYSKLTTTQTTLAELESAKESAKQKLDSLEKKAASLSPLDVMLNSKQVWDLKTEINAVTQEYENYNKQIKTVKGLQKNYIDQLNEIGESIDYIDEKSHDGSGRRRESVEEAIEGINDVNNELKNFKIQSEHNGKTTLQMNASKFTNTLNYASNLFSDKVNIMNSKPIIPSVATANAVGGFNIINNEYSKKKKTIEDSRISPSVNSSTATTGFASILSTFNKVIGNPAVKVKYENDTTSLNNVVKHFSDIFKEAKITIGTDATTGVGLLGIQKRAMGGFVDEGQLFIAREAGPELVGSMGGHTAVANNQQITDGIARAVYGAFTSALSATNRGSSGDIIVNIDGKQVFKAVQKQATNYVAQTGQTPFPI